MSDTYREYVKKRFAEMKNEPEFKGLKAPELTSIIASEWTNRTSETTIIEEPKEDIDIKEKEPAENIPIDDEAKYQYKCDCGYYFNDPIPARCPKCGCDLVWLII